jgi:hypothetical protein
MPKQPGKADTPAEEQQPDELKLDKETLKDLDVSDVSGEVRGGLGLLPLNTEACGATGLKPQSMALACGAGMRPSLPAAGSLYPCF